MRNKAQSVLVMAFLAVTPATAKSEQVKAQSASEFLGTIGVNLHMGTPEVGQRGTSYNSLSNTIRQLSFINVHYARETVFIGSDIDKLKTLYTQLGVKFDLVYDNYGPEGGQTILDRAFATVRAAPDLIDAIEGPNEPDWFGITFDGLTKAEAVVAAQKALYAAVKGDRELSSVKVYCPALSFPARGGLADTIGDLSAYCDYATAHPYPLNDSLGIFAPDPSLKVWTLGPTTVTAPGRPLAITEGGWTTCPEGAAGVDELTQAKYMLAYLLDAFNLGVRRTYLYELSDEVDDPKCDNGQVHYGLFNNNGKPKLAAASLANFNAVLRGRDTREQSLSYSITGLPAATGHQTLFRIGDGKFVLALWNEGVLWDRNSHSPLRLPDVRAELSFERQPALMQLYDPLLSAKPQQTTRLVSKLAVSVPDHPVLLLIEMKR